MAFKFDNIDLQDSAFNGTDINFITFNGTTVWERNTGPNEWVLDLFDPTSAVYSASNVVVNLIIL